MADDMNENSAMEDGELSDEQLEQAAGGLVETTAPGGLDSRAHGKLESVEMAEEEQLKDPTGP